MQVALWHCGVAGATIFVPIAGSQQGAFAFLGPDAALSDTKREAEVAASGIPHTIVRAGELIMLQAAILIECQGKKVLNSVSCRGENGLRALRNTSPS